MQLDIVETIAMYYMRKQRMKKLLAFMGSSDKKWTAESYVQDQFDKAMKETMLRAEDKVVK